MALKYLVSNTTYDFSGSQYTNIVGGSKRLNYIASGKTHQLGLATDKTCSQYSPLIMKVNGTNHYIGRSTSGSLSSSRSTSNTYTVLNGNTYTTINGYRSAQSTYATTGYMTGYCEIIYLRSSLSFDQNNPQRLFNTDTGTLNRLKTAGFTTSISNNGTAPFGYGNTFTLIEYNDYNGYGGWPMSSYTEQVYSSRYRSNQFSWEYCTLIKCSYISQINVAYETSTGSKSTAYNSAIMTTLTSYKTNTHTSSSSVSGSYSTSSHNFV